MLTSPRETELLLKLAEECSEVIQQVSKTLLYGFESSHPESSIDNRGMLEDECGHVINSIRMLCGKDLDSSKINHSADKKALTIGQWLRHQDDKS